MITDPRAGLIFQLKISSLQPLTGKHGHGEILKMETLENKLRD